MSMQALVQEPRRSIGDMEAHSANVSVPNRASQIDAARDQSYDRKEGGGGGTDLYFLAITSIVGDLR